MAYWGFENIYSFGAVDNDGNEIGSLVRFDSRSDRNNWINEDGQKREPLSSKEARRIMEHDYRRAADPEDVRLGIYTMSEYVRLLSMDQFWDWYSDKSRW